MILPYGLHWLPLLMCTVLSIILGALWFSPVLFGRTWLRLSGVTKDKMNISMSAWAFVVNIVMSFCIALILGMFFQLAMIEHPVPGVIIAVVLWLMLGALPMLNHSLYEERPGKLFLISASYDFVVVVLSALILSVWR